MAKRDFRTHPETCWERSEGASHAWFWDKLFVSHTAPGRRLLAVADLDRDQLARMLDDPEAFLWENLARPVKLDHTCLAVRGTLDCGGRPVPVLYKCYRPRNWWKRLLARFRRGRAMQSWHGSHTLVMHGIPTARPLAVCQVHRGSLQGCGYLAIEWIEGAENLHVYGWRLANLPMAERDAKALALAESLAALVGRMHAAGVAHGDLKAANLLVVDTAQGPIVYLIDTDDVWASRRLGRRRHVADLARLATSMEAHPWIAPTLVVRFFRIYLRQFAVGRADWKSLRRQVARRSRRIIRLIRRRGERVL